MAPRAVWQNLQVILSPRGLICLINFHLAVGLDQAWSDLTLKVDVVFFARILPGLYPLFLTLRRSETLGPPNSATMGSGFETPREREMSMIDFLGRGQRRQLWRKPCNEHATASAINTIVLKRPAARLAP